MIHAHLHDREIIVVADEADAEHAGKLPGATRSARMPPRTWRMPLACDSIRELKSVQAKASTELLRAAKQLFTTEQYVEAQKQLEHVSPIRPLPVKPEYALYAHQIKGYNIALALMGYAPEGEDHDET